MNKISNLNELRAVSLDQAPALSKILSIAINNSLIKINSIQHKPINLQSTAVIKKYNLT